MTASAAIRAYCGRCRSQLRVLTTTDGDGVVIDLVEPCPECIARARARATLPRMARPPKPAKRRPEPRCHGCLRDLTYSGRGRVPKWCEQCRPKPRRRRERTTPHCVVCGSQIPYSGRGRPPVRCVEHGQRPRNPRPAQHPNPGA